MKEILTQYARFNIWANNQVITELLKLDNDLLYTELKSSFSTIPETVIHTWSAEALWLQRLQLAEQPQWMQDMFNGTFQDACAEWQKTSQALLAFVEKQYSDASFEHIMQYQQTPKQSFKAPVHQVLQHVFNHSTHHRGQIVSMMRQLGITSIPRTDLIFFHIK